MKPTPFPVTQRVKLALNPRGQILKHDFNFFEQLSDRRLIYGFFLFDWFLEFRQDRFRLLLECSNLHNDRIAIRLRIRDSVNQLHNQLC